MAEDDRTTQLERALEAERQNARTWERRSKRNRDDLDFWRGRAARLQDELHNAHASLNTTSRKDTP